MPVFADPARRQWAIVGGVFALVVLLLGLGYYAFLRGGDAVLVERVRPGEAAAIVAELDKRGTAYRLRDGGTTILVPEGEADAIRLSLVRSDAVTGFELFNKSDMGLTNFAQKINYQRALQGELVRTITLMDGVEAARVHLALPERALFRDDRTEPSAAVTVTMRGGLTPDPARVAGIQRLVSAAVADLPPERVVVLDADGRVLTQGSAAPAGDAVERSADAAARSAVEQYYQARARGAIDAVLPQLRYRLQAMAMPQGDQPFDPARWTPGEAGQGRNFRLRLTLVTAQPIDPATQATIEAAVAPAVGMREADGDLLTFETGSIAAPPVASAIAPAPRMPTRSAAPVPVEVPGPRSDAWWWLLLAVPVALLVLLRWRAGRDAPDEEDHAAFARALQRQLAREGSGDGAR
ncbi:flagellar basal-body MS-ring/collar protein FliF [Sphingomonas sp. VNH70]|uniref:flagellar basal-body MS-ring/collar protein FliF n=1 Tax=Sphingomonas silueang TaxID=3156617 RepID=UPI0032B46469